MKIRLSELRQLIREAVEGDEAKKRPRPSRLAKKLFLHDKRCNVLRDLYKKRHGKSLQYSEMVRRDIRDDFVRLANDFVERNAAKLAEITRGGAVESLGSGRMGDAYRYTGDPDKILKMQRRGPSDMAGLRHGDIASRLYGGDPLGRSYPMVYASSTDPGESPLTSEDGLEVDWAIMERLNVIPDDLIDEMDSILGMMLSAYNVGGTAADAAANRRGALAAPADRVLQSNADDITTVGNAIRELDTTPVEVKRLVGGGKAKYFADGPDVVELPRWYVELFGAVLAVLKNSEADLHAGNLGFRRNGDWVFFD